LRNALGVNFRDSASSTLDQKKDKSMKLVKSGKLCVQEEWSFTLDDSKWIFIVSTTKVLYVGQKKTGHFSTPVTELVEP